MTTPTTRPLNVVLCWHMHQPWYRESLEGEYRLPWVYLHALKDYADMAAHLEAHPKLRCVVNFTPVLLEQLDDYAHQFADHLKHGSAFKDPLLNLLAGTTPIPQDGEGRKQIVHACRRAHAPLMIDIYPQFRELLNLALNGVTQQTDPVRIGYLNAQYFVDLLIWYHLAWFGHSLKQLPRVKRLLQHVGPFSDAARRELIEIMRDAFADLIARYTKLADAGQIELSMTPYGHPIVPLLIDLESMRCAQPNAPAPDAPAYPDGLSRARWHMQEGIRVFEHFLGRKPGGVWLSEGAVSEEALQLLDEFDINWSASGEGVWNNSRRLSGLETQGEQARRSLFCSHAVDDCTTRMFFRDDGLSDLIGFEYQQWDATAAAADFKQHLNNIARYLGDSCDQHVVSVVLDGENAWEYYRDNAFHFLGALYEQLASDPAIRPITFSEALNTCPPQSLNELCPGSWVYGSFSTWIGDKDKNRAWELLIEAKRVYDDVVARKRLTKATRAKLERQLAICEGSDWFWWFGDYNPATSVSDFDQLFRRQLSNLYQLLGEKVPSSLTKPVSAGGGNAENSGTMRRGNA